jgi:drug/metabolite transporter (DMT)-like permease
MWYSMMYLPLAEATVITFLAPMLAGYICHVLLKDPFTRREQLASLLALAGVVLIARPTSLFGTTTTTPDQTNSTTPTPHSETSSDDTPPTQRLIAILVALLGVLGAAGAYTTIRYIGKRAHALITVTYFSVWSTLVSTTALLLFPFLGIGQAEPPIISFAGLLPETGYEWFLLVSLGLCGFVMQFMMTAGIGGERSNRATAMVYTHMLFAAGFDRWVFGHRMGVVSVVGCGLVVGSAVWAALGRKGGRDGEGRKEVGEGDVERGGRREEGVPMLDGSGGEEDEGEREREEGENGGSLLGRVRSRSR